MFEGDDRSVIAAWRKAGHPDEWIAAELGYPLEAVQSVKPQRLFVPTPAQIAAQKADIQATWSASEARRRETGETQLEQRSRGVEFPQFCERTGKALG